MMDLIGRHVVITGASSGIGLATASKIVSLGGRVTLIARRAGALEDAQHALGDDASFEAVDVADKMRLLTALDNAVYRAALHRLARSTTSIGGVPIPAGTIVTLGLGTANRDPRHFEAPNDFKHRANVRDHIAFSRGIHACPGAPLARSETRITLERFLDRMADIRISEAEHGPPNARHYDYEPTYLLRGLSALHIEFNRAS
jgi:NAD(P)-dependent dehydrogenase (short-subunit alcohol dehydrogenase family)